MNPNKRLKHLLTTKEIRRKTKARTTNKQSSVCVRGSRGLRRGQAAVCGKLRGKGVVGERDEVLWSTESHEEKKLADSGKEEQVEEREVKGREADGREVEGRKVEEREVEERDAVSL